MILIILVTDFGHSGDDFGSSGGIPQCSDQRAKQYEKQDHAYSVKSRKDASHAYPI